MELQSLSNVPLDLSLIFSCSGFLVNTCKRAQRSAQVGQHYHKILISHLRIELEFFFCACFVFDQYAWYHFHKDPVYQFLFGTIDLTYIKIKRFLCLYIQPLIQQHLSLFLQSPWSLQWLYFILISFWSVFNVLYFVFSCFQ